MVLLVREQGSLSRKIRDHSGALIETVRGAGQKGGDTEDNYAEKRYGAGIAWSPRENYSVAFRVNRLDESRSSDTEFLRSGEISWTPRRNLEFSLNYGDQLVEGERGVMISTRLKLDRS